MIGYIKGKVLYFCDDYVLMENNGIGYEVICSNEARKTLLENMEGEIYTYMALREDGVSLFGFNSMEEKEIFLKLISVSGVGPKMGIGILSAFSVKELVSLIATGNVKVLSSAKGLGKKTAERIILELQDKMGVDSTGTFEVTKKVDSNVYDDAISALMSLGFSKTESSKALDGAIENGATSLEAQIAYAMKHIR